uniref:Neur_chan_memb domain-containing protein n=1 Tax=Macrostomum lignano TaxID=282301 RepID=A0A1I8GAV3_9PLAT
TCQAMDVWMSICLLFVFASLLEFAVVNVFSRKEIRKKSQGLNILSETAKNFEEMICAQALTVPGLSNMRPARRQQPGAAGAVTGASFGAKRRDM